MVKFRNIMKQIGKLLLLLSSAAMLVQSCNIEKREARPEKTEIRFSAIFPEDPLSNMPDTKTELQPQENGGATVLWKQGDRISVFGTQPVEGTYDNEEFTTSENGQSAIFTGTAYISDGYVAIYPYNSRASYDGNNITTYLPAEQNAVKDGFESGINPSVAVSNGNTFTFDNLCGLVKFTIDKNVAAETAASINAVRFSGNRNEDLAGTIIIDSENRTLSVTQEEDEKSVILNGPFETGASYYLTVAPGKLTEGFTITFIDGNGGTFSKSGSKEATITAGRILNIGSLVPVFTTDKIRHINSYDDIESLIISQEFLEADIILDANIDLTGHDWTPIGTIDMPFRGNFNGNGKKITGLDTRNKDYAGFFGVTGAGARIYDVTFESPVIENTGSNGFAGTVCGLNGGKIERCTVINATVNGKYAGGICGNNSIQVTGCTVISSQITSTADGTAGGIAGDNYGTIRGCRTEIAEGQPVFTVTASGYQANAGGIAGKNSDEKYSATGGRIVESSASNIIITGDNAGGIAGYNNAGTIYLSVSESNDIGNVVDGTERRTCGGIAGYNTRGLITACLSTGNSIGRDNVPTTSLGGIAGINTNRISSIYGCKADAIIFKGTVAGDESGLGGIAGYSSSGKITSCLSSHAPVKGNSSGTVSSSVTISDQADYGTLTVNVPSLTTPDGTIWNAADIWDLGQKPPVIKNLQLK